MVDMVMLDEVIDTSIDEQLLLDDDTDGEEDLLLIGPPKELAVSKEKDSLHYIFINSKQHLDVILREKHSKKRLWRNFNFFKH